MYRSKKSGSRFITTLSAGNLPLAFFGMFNGMGCDRGAASALDQAILPATVPDSRRTWALAWYNVTLDGGHALGALAAIAPTVLMRGIDVTTQAAHQLTFMVCAAAMLICIVPYLALTPRIEVPTDGASSLTRPPVDPRSKRIIARLALLFGLDSIGGGFLNSALIAYWLFLQYGTSEPTSRSCSSRLAY